ncbi:hypothetical protein BC940DRAFT_74239 [Gongronella butleri]|nr:hypothetical protein BC940DRAFT_74239 [Gongronella butleri]
MVTRLPRLSLYFSGRIDIRPASEIQFRAHAQVWLITTKAPLFHLFSCFCMACSFATYSTQIAATLDSVQQELDRVAQQQETLYEELCRTRDASVTDDEMAGVKEMLEKTREYYGKLLQLRTTMVNVSLKSKQLLKRADKLRASKVAYLGNVDAIRRREQQRDQSIAAKIHPSSSSTSLNQWQQHVAATPPSSEPSMATTPPNPTNSPPQPSAPSPSLPHASSSPPPSIAMPLASISPMSAPTIADLAPMTEPVTPSSPSVASATPSSPATSISASPALTPLAMAKPKKKKKKPKAREVEIGGDDEPAWVPRRATPPVRRET